METYQYIIIIGVLLIIAFSIVKMNKKDLKLELNKLVELLGGKDNILDTEVEMSRFKVTLRDVTKANKEGILKLGAKGVVEIDDQLKIVLGPEAKKLKKYIDELNKDYFIQKVKKTNKIRQNTTQKYLYNLFRKELYYDCFCVFKFFIFVISVFMLHFLYNL